HTMSIYFLSLHDALPIWGSNVTNLDPNPELIDFNAPHNALGLSAGFEEKLGSDYIVEVLEPRLVPLGGPRAMTVQRTIPQRARSLIGAWCFLDYFGDRKSVA